MEKDLSTHASKTHAPKTHTPPFENQTPPQVRDLLTFYKYPGDAIPVVKGSALAALNGDKVRVGGVVCCFIGSVAF